jgi:hypothetical protein
MPMTLTHTQNPGGTVTVAFRDSTGNNLPVDDILFTVGDGGTIVALTWNSDTSALTIEGVGIGSASINVNTTNANFAGAANGTFGATVVAGSPPTEFAVTVSSGTLTIL